MNPQNKTRPHAELIHAWADGATIQIKKDNGEWEDCLSNRPAWNEKTEYRIKPKEGNEPWVPEKCEKYFFLNVVEGEIRVDYHTWHDDEIDLIKALRNAGGIYEVFKFEKTLLVANGDNGAMSVFDGHVAFITERGGARSIAIIRALKQIKAEQEANK